MDPQLLYGNEYFTLSSKQDTVYIEVVSEGFSLKDFDQVLQNVPRVALTQFFNLKNALQSAGTGSVEIGVLKPRVAMMLAGDLLAAKIRLHVTESELEMNLPEITSEIMETLRLDNITEGIQEEVLRSGLKPREDITIALGIRPVNGEDAVIQYYELSERKPLIQQDGSADHYEMNFLDEVKKGEWLGEKVQAGAGTPGRTVTGKALPAMPGMDRPLYYDKKTVVEVDEGEKIVLRAKIDGVLTLEDGNVTVQEVLIIEEDVGGATGNIDYDGSVIVKGTIKDGFSVAAAKDISVLGEIGLGAIGSIVSRTGDIYIKGGIFGKEKARIQAARHVYIKHANECGIEAGGDIHIGFYAIGCNLTANNIFLDTNRGRIIGGQIRAKAQVVTAIIGNEAERATSIHIEGFDRIEVQEEFDELVGSSRKLEIIMNRLLSELDGLRIANEQGKRTAMPGDQAIQLKYEQIRRAALSMDERRLALANVLKAKGEGQVAVMRKAFPKTSLLIKGIAKDLESPAAGVFYIRDRTLYFE